MIRKKITTLIRNWRKQFFISFQVCLQETYCFDLPFFVNVFPILSTLPHQFQIVPEIIFSDRDNSNFLISAFKYKYPNPEVEKSFQKLGKIEQCLVDILKEGKNLYFSQNYLCWQMYDRVNYQLWPPLWKIAAREEGSD